MTEENKTTLDMFYVKQAVKHLAVIEECQQKIGELGNINMLDIQKALHTEVKKLKDNDSAYSEAAEILNSIRSINFKRR